MFTPKSIGSHFNQFWLRTHFDFSCVDFYTWIQNQTQLWSEIHGSEKYKTKCWLKQSYDVSKYNEMFS
jgi:hypothetical protein